MQACKQATDTSREGAEGQGSYSAKAALHVTLLHSQFWGPFFGLGFRTSFQEFRFAFCSWASLTCSKARLAYLFWGFGKKIENI
jgi:hypothetical protein